MKKSNLIYAVCNFTISICPARLLLIILLAWGWTFNAYSQYTNLLNFAGANGMTPFGSLISDGTYLYGMTQQGGLVGGGNIIKIRPDGTGYVDLHDFTGSPDGSKPRGSLISDGTFLYGMTELGGTFNQGTIFKIKPDGTGYLKLLNFESVPYGTYPYGSLFYDGTFLYGMTKNGGIGLGVIFKMMPDGTGFIKLHEFTGNDGSGPQGSLISDGTFLYGMTAGGGNGNSGVIFKIKPDGTEYSVILNLDFAGIVNGATPNGDLYYDGTFLYGMTQFGGTNSAGVIFKIKPDGTEYLKLLDFAGASNGKLPNGSLISDGTFLYGLTQKGGANDGGVIFKIMLDGTGYSKLFDFTTASGYYPYGSLLSDGTSLYGMTWGGGSGFLGTLFKYGIATGVSQTTSDLPEIYTLSQNYPNPFNPSTTIRFAVKNKGFVSVKVYDLLGREVAALVSGEMAPGSYAVSWEAEGVSSGMYFCRMTTEGYNGVRKLLLLR